VKTSVAGIALIKRWEGCRLRAYKDAVGIYTIGYGHTSMAGPPKVTRGMVITKQQAEAILIQDLVKYEKAVDEALTRKPTQTQFDAFVSLCFNIGPDAFARSSVVRHFNEGRFQASADAFKLWVKAGRPKRRLAGLVNRRAAERAHFLSSVA
jgi:lysozyme